MENKTYIHTIETSTGFKHLISKVENPENMAEDILEFNTAMQFCEEYRKASDEQVVNFYKHHLKTVYDNIKRAIADKGLTKIAAIEFGYAEVNEENTNIILEYDIGSWYTYRVYLEYLAFVELRENIINVLSNPSVKAITYTKTSNNLKRGKFNTFNLDFKVENIGTVRHISKLDTKLKEKYLLNILTYIKEIIDEIGV